MEKVCFQIQEKGCGYASVKMALVALSGKRGYLYADEPPIGLEAPSLEEIKAYAHGFGLTLAAYEATKPSEILHNVDYPLLINLLEDGLLHMVVLRRKKGRRFLLLDPIKGKRVLSGSELVALFQGTFLSVEGFQEKGEVPKKERVLPIGTLLALGCLSFFPAPLLLLAFVFLSSGSTPNSLSFPAAAGAAFLLSILGRIFTLAKMKEFDARYSPFLLHPDSGKRRELFLHYHAYKQGLFGGLPGASFLLSEIAAMVLFFLLSDWALGLACCAGLLLVAVDFLIESPLIETRERKAMELERRYLGQQGSEQSQAGDLNGLLHLGQSHGEHLSLRSFLLGVGLASIGILFSFQGDGFLLTRTVFYLFSVFFVGREWDKALFALSRAEDFQREEAYFRGHFLRK